MVYLYISEIRKLVIDLTSWQLPIYELFTRHNNYQVHTKIILTKPV